MGAYGVFAPEDSRVRKDKIAATAAEGGAKGISLPKYVRRLFPALVGWNSTQFGPVSGYWWFFSFSKVGT